MKHNVRYRTEMKSQPLTKKRTQPPRKKYVRFSKDLKRYSEPPTNLIPIEGDADKIWYQPGDYKKIHNEILENLKAFVDMNGNISLLNHDRHCMRGLEMKVSKKISQLRKLRIVFTVRAILNTQKSLQLKGVNNPELLGVISRRLTVKAEQQARKLGVIDENTILNSRNSTKTHVET